ncbi:hypothetical protein GNI_136390 [Gregarina niphandrodes]|uniref:Uncharacterized protein n=1 Tax=Gregarina niphandrodes TaxID=110365 RepID=A0A023B0S6_GRENI|nr:hypothetical protein GNI_136390 [Gregarina niphandrodes]EZG45899.1 hypothetical protein GNI_136390 [Gregarina niphandrodes]|eukprot:XP_011132425.1 hypothetical protein GNI_136390 [Gregarina niphandrodes]
MNQASDALLGQGVECYIDDMVMRVCIDNGFFMKLAKYEWLRKEIPLLGHAVGKCGIKLQSGKVEVLSTVALPKDYSDKMQPLQELMNSQKTQNFA